MNFSKIILYFLICQAFLSCCAVGISEEGFHLKPVFKKLIRDNPTVILLDNDESELEIHVREALLSVENAGSVTYTFNPWWRITSTNFQIKPKVGSTKTTPFRWTFLCLIEEKRTRVRAEKYLEQLLLIGHGRKDRFMLLGEYNFLSTFMRSPSTEKFLNIMAIPLNKNVTYQRQFMRDNENNSRFKTMPDLKCTYWYRGKTSGLNGKHFKISGTKFPPYLDIVYENGKQKLMGVNYQIFHQGSVYYNYTYEFNPESSWKLTGVRHKNGTWDGVFGDVIYGKADIASVSTQTMSRSGFADFVGPFGRAHLVFVSSPPETFLGKYAIFRSYTIDVWGLILAFYLLFVMLFHKALQFAQQIIGSVRGNKSFLRAVITIWSLSLEQTLEKRPKGTRLVMILWVLFGIVILTGYRSNMSAFISFPLPESKPGTFEQLNEANNYQIYFDLSGVSAYTYFEESNNSMFKNLKKRAITEKNTTACVVNAFMKRKTACIGWDFTLNMAASRNMTIPQLESPLYTSAEPIWAAWYTFALAKNSIYTNAFQYIGQSSFETGLTAYWRNRILNRYRDYSIHWSKINRMNSTLFEKLAALRRRSKNETKPLKIENFQFIFLILLAGIFISTLLFLYEVSKGKKMTCWKKRHFYQQTANLHQLKAVSIDFVP